MGSVTYISWSIYFALYHCHKLKLFLYIKKWHRPGVLLSLRALALVWQAEMRNFKEVKMLFFVFNFKKIPDVMKVSGLFRDDRLFNQ